MLNEETKKATLKRLFEEDIEEFGKFFFPHHLSLATPQFHREIYEVFESDLTRIGIGAPRGHAKSTITDLVYVAWEIVHKRRKFILQVSDTYSQAVMFLEALKSEFEGNELLRAYYGNLATEKWSEGEIIVNGIMVKALGAGMKVRGLKYKESRPDLIVVDDLENDELVESIERRDKLERWVNGALIPSMGKGGRIVFIGTILHYDSLLAKILDKERYIEFYKKTYRAITDDKALWPEHLNMEELEKIKQDYIAKGQGYLFYQEYQNDPVSGENRKFKLEKIKYYDASTEMGLQGKLINHYIAIDRAYSLDKVADFTGIVVIATDQENNWYVKLAERFKGTEKDLISKIFDLKHYFDPIMIGIEQKAFEFTIKPALDDEMRKRNDFIRVEELKDLGKNKNIRIEGLIPRFESGTVYLKRDQVNLLDELMQFPRGIHDDLIDALAYLLSLAQQAGKGMSAKAYTPLVHKYASVHYPSRKV
jgi:phage terminase large subunit-like protein